MEKNGNEKKYYIHFDFADILNLRTTNSPAAACAGAAAGFNKRPCSRRLCGAGEFADSGRPGRSDPASRKFK
jgi:hypothetical protein